MCEQDELQWKEFFHIVTILVCNLFGNRVSCCLNSDFS